MERFRLMIRSLCLLIASLSGPSFLLAQISHPQVDLVVYGATASGVMTAYAASREGLHVILLEPGHHVGGMVTGGLSATDLGKFQIIGGYAREFYLEAAVHYGVQDLSIAPHWLSEPHVDEAIFREWLSKANVELHLQERLRVVLRSEEHNRCLCLDHASVMPPPSSAATHYATFEEMPHIPFQSPLHLCYNELPAPSGVPRCL